MVIIKINNKIESKGALCKHLNYKTIGEHSIMCSDWHGLKL